MATYYDMRFRQKLDKALAQTRLVLERERLVRPESAPHAYGDKFAVAECVTKFALESALTFGALLGINDKSPIATNKTPGKTSLAFESEVNTTYVGERTRDVEGPTVTVLKQTKSSGFLGGKSSKEESTQVVTKVTEHVWSRSFRGRLVAKRGDMEIATLLDFETSCEAVTANNTPPAGVRSRPPATLADADWLFNLPRGNVAFEIDREKAKTPRRNDDVEAVLKRLQDLAQFARSVRAAIPGATDVDGCVRTAVDATFQPVACCALVEAENGGDDAKAPGSEHLSALMKHARQTAFAANDAMQKEIAAVISLKERSAGGSALVGLVDEGAARLLFGCHLLEALAGDLRGSLNHIEAMLYAQLRDACGKEVTASDFDDFMASHEKRLFKAAYRPTPLSAPVRRDATAFPEGSIAVERGDRTPVLALSRAVPDFGDRLLRIPIDAATVLSAKASTYAHAITARSWGRRSPPPLTLALNARQFSSFVVLLGTVTASDEFEPARAVVVSNKDEVLIPLLLEPLPAPKAFRDAIESLSPEQQGFCRAFREMQLASSLFGILVVQVKPQVEAVLNLPPGSLTKEIELNEALMRYFVEYHIPTDLLSYDGDASEAAASKVAAVKQHAETIEALVDGAAARDLEDKTRRAAASQLDQLREEAEASTCSPSTCGSDDAPVDLMDGGLLCDLGPPARSMKTMKKGGGLFGKGGGRSRGAAPGRREVGRRGRERAL